MREIRGKRPRIREEPHEYRELWTLVLQRDGWRCQRCGSFMKLQVHHISSAGRAPALQALRSVPKTPSLNFSF
jgi:hypothetical protein